MDRENRPASTVNNQRYLSHEEYKAYVEALQRERIELERKATELMRRTATRQVEIKELRNRILAMRKQWQVANVSSSVSEGQKASLKLDQRLHSKSETWSLRWLAVPTAWLFPKADREEWLGDLKEMHYELIGQEHYPHWLINAITVGRILILVWSSVEIRVLDLVSRIRGAS